MGYNAIHQLTGYIITEDPSYVTTRNGARAKIQRLDRDEVLCELLRAYLEK